jgi:cell division protein FtsB
MIDVAQIVAKQRLLVELWHAQEIENSCRDLMYLVCEQHRFNFLLWHEEDKARSAEASDMQIAAVKRAIDRYNQQRNDATEQIDDYLKSWLESQDITPAADAPLNTETPGSAIDRLSILALRLYHMREQTERADASADHIARARQKLTLMHDQQRDLSAALAELWADLLSGRKRLALYRQFKMYNDPTLNPYLYKPAQRLAG